VYASQIVHLVQLSTIYVRLFYASKAVLVQYMDDCAAANQLQRSSCSSISS